MNMENCIGKQLISVTVDYNDKKGYFIIYEFGDDTTLELPFRPNKIFKYGEDHVVTAVVDREFLCC